LTNSGQGESSSNKCHENKNLYSKHFFFDSGKKWKKKLYFWSFVYKDFYL
jgi:hypothetical protein